MKIALVVLGVLALGAAGYLGYTYVQPSSTEVSQESQSTTGETIDASLVELLALGRDTTCSFTTTTAEGTTDGNVYISDRGESMRGDFVTATDAEENYNSHMIKVNNQIYVWMDSEAQGFTAQIDPESDTFFPDSEDENTEVASFDEHAQTTFSCNPWTPDRSMFAPPTNIEFIDFSAQIEALESITPQELQSGEIDCSVCDQVPAGDAQNQCRAALGC